MNMSELRNAFWEEHPQYAYARRTRKRQNDYNADIRVAWVNFVDAMEKEGFITESVSYRATL